MTPPPRSPAHLSTSLLLLAGLAASAACVQQLPGPTTPTGVLPSATTTAEPEWLPLAPRVGRPVAADPRESALAEPRRLTEGLEVQQLAWAPSSRRLAFVAQRNSSAPASAELVDLSSGVQRRLSLEAEAATSLRFLDDDHVAFVARSGARHFVVTARVDGTERRTLELAQEPLAIAPSSGAEALWLTVQREGGTALARADREGTSLRILVERTGGGGLDASTSRASIAFVGEGGALVLASDEGRAPRSLPLETHGRAKSPAFDPRGEQLYYASDLDSLGGEIYRVDLQASTWPPRAERLTFAQGSLAAPSPDRRWIAFASRRSGPSADLHLARLRGGAE